MNIIPIHQEKTTTFKVRIEKLYMKIASAILKGQIIWAQQTLWCADLNLRVFQSIIFILINNLPKAPIKTTTFIMKKKMLTQSITSAILYAMQAQNYKKNRLSFFPACIYLINWDFLLDQMNKLSKDQETTTTRIVR
jgi:hypothetical protein